MFYYCWDCETVYADDSAHVLRDPYDDSLEERNTTAPRSTARSQADKQTAALIRQHERRLEKRMIALDDAPPGRDAKKLRDLLAERLHRIADLG